MARVKDEVIDVMERDGVQCAEAMRILENEWALDALYAKECEKYAEVDRQISKVFDGFINVVRGDK